MDKIEITVTADGKLKIMASIDGTQYHDEFDEAPPKVKEFIKFVQDKGTKSS